MFQKISNILKIIIIYLCLITAIDGYMWKTVYQDLASRNRGVHRQNDKWSSFGGIDGLHCPFKVSASGYQEHIVYFHCPRKSISGNILLKIILIIDKQLATCCSQQTSQLQGKMK